MRDIQYNVMNEGPLKKVSISQFQIRNASDVASSPVTPVKIAPPPSTVKRSKSLKTGAFRT